MDKYQGFEKLTPEQHELALSQKISYFNQKLALMGREQELMRQRQTLVMARQDLSFMQARNTCTTGHPNAALYQMGEKALG